MTREEAINILAYHKSNVPENSLITNALDMAVKALEQEPDAIHNEREQAYMKGYEDASKRYREECVFTPWHRFNPDDEATFPKPGKYILLSFSNWMIPAVGEYRQTEDGGGNFFLADSDDPLVKIGIFVNAWMPLPECYKED